jgi:hypothetical protein
MQLLAWRSFVAPLCALMLTGCVHGRGADARSLWAERDREAAVLVAHPTPDNLAVAALLAEDDNRDSRQSLKLIERAETLAPRRPELLWLHLAICERLKCDAEAQITAHLLTVDPANGFAWLPELERAQSSGPEAVTAAIARIGASATMTFYWNQLEVMMVDALAVANPSEDLATRGVVAIGMLAAQVIPALQPMSRACQLGQLELPGRRAACEALVMRMEQSSSVLTQSLALSLEERWWPAGSPRGEIVRAKHRRLDYLLTKSSRIRFWHRNTDMAVRIDTARHTDREEDVELAMVKSFGLPLEPPVNWKDAFHPL